MKSVLIKISTTSIVIALRLGASVADAQEIRFTMTPSATKLRAGEAFRVDYTFENLGREPVPVWGDENGIPVLAFGDSCGERGIDWLMVQRCEVKGNPGEIRPGRKAEWTRLVMPWMSGGQRAISASVWIPGWPLDRWPSSQRVEFSVEPTATPEERAIVILIEEGQTILHDVAPEKDLLDRMRAVLDAPGDPVNPPQKLTLAYLYVIGFEKYAFGRQDREVLPSGENARLLGPIVSLGPGHPLHAHATIKMIQAYQRSNRLDEAWALVNDFCLSYGGAPALKMVLSEKDYMIRSLAFGSAAEQYQAWTAYCNDPSRSFMTPEDKERVIRTGMATARERRQRGG